MKIPELNRKLSVPKNFPRSPLNHLSLVIPARKNKGQQTFEPIFKSEDSKEVRQIMLLVAKVYPQLIIGDFVYLKGLVLELDDENYNPRSPRSAGILLARLAKEKRLPLRFDHIAKSGRMNVYEVL